MAKTRRSYKGGAASTTTGTSIAASGATTFTIAAYTGWPYGTPPFFVVVEPGTANEEKILVTRAGATDTTINIYATPSVAANRGMDGTTAFLHASGSTVYPVFTATDADEANELASTLTTQGDILIHGASTFGRVGIGTAAQVLKVNSSATAPEWGQVATAGIADSAITSAKIADGAIVDADVNASAAIAKTKISGTAITAGDTGTVTSTMIADGTIVDADINASAAIALSKLATGALPTAITVASANLVDGTIVNADVNASAGITSGKLAGVFTTASGANRTITISTSAPSGGSDGDIWFKY